MPRPRPGRATLNIVRAQTPEHLADIRALFREYEAFLGVDLCFQGFEDELAGLPGKYAPPGGALFLALEGTQVAGCVALRRFGEGVCEMKRLFVRPQFKGRGFGKRLAARVVDEAVRLGYATMLLDTLDRLDAAMGIYRSLGFVQTEAYYPNPLPGVVYWRLELKGGANHRTPPIVVRDATEADMAAVQRIYAHHVLNGLATFEEVPPDLGEMLARRAKLLGLGLPFLAAETDGTVAGYAYASPYRPRPAYRYTVEDSVYVDAALAGRGLGRALLAALIARCERGAWRQMIAIIGNSGNEASIALHRRFDFRMVGTLHGVGFKLGRWVDTVLMQRDLGAGSGTPPTAFGVRSHPR